MSMYDAISRFRASGSKDVDALHDLLINSTVMIGVAQNLLERAIS